MRLEKLEIKGFKSFPDKTVLEFKSGITSVVGPNGCGKSNVIEAIRWVMGEQRPRLLRGAKMGDVIFNGSETRKPVGMAEVRMVLSLASGTGPRELAGYDEIMVARRLFRDGESQYEINNVPCRMSDVVDLFLDTGLVRNSYAIIEQGRVEMVVASKPEERRWLIEEAAGISRYKFRKETAGKRLEQAEANLNRIRDLVLEVKRQATGLGKQASKVQRYRALHKELRDLELHAHALQCREVSRRQQTCREALARARDASLAVQARTSTAAAKLHEERQLLTEQEQASKSLLHQKHLCEVEMESMRSAISRSEERLLELRLQHEMLMRDRDEKIQLTKQTRQRLHDAETQLKTFKSRMEDTEARMGDVARDLAALKKERSVKQQELESLRASLFEHLQDRATKKNMRDSRARRAAELSARTKRISNERDELETSLKTSREMLESLSVELQSTSRELTDMQGEHAALSRTIESSRLRIAEIRSNLGSAETEHAAALSRMRSMEEVAKSFAHYGQGVQQVMLKGAPRMEGSLDGPLAELIDVPAEYEKSLAAALEQRLGSVVVTSPEEGARSLDLLKGAGQSRTKFVPKKPRFVSIRDDIHGVPGTVRLLDVVRFKEGYEDLAQYLLGRCLLVKDLSHALEIWSRNGIPLDLVTVEGEFLTRHGELTGGSWDVGPERVFAQRRQISELSRRVASLEHEIHGRKEELASAEQARDSAVARHNELAKRITDLRLTDVTQRGEMERIRSRITGLHRRCEALDLEKKALDHETSSITADTQLLEREIQALEHEVARLQQSSQTMKARAAKLDEEYESLSKTHADTQVELAQYNERFLAAQQELATAKNFSAQVEAGLEKIARDSQATRAETERTQRRMQEAQENEKRLMLRHKTVSEELDEVVGKSRDLAQHIRTLEEQLAQAQAEEKTLGEEVHSLEMQEIQHQQSIEVLVQRMLERYGVDPRTITPQGQNPLPDDIAAARKEIESLGEINMAAVEEFQKVQERLDFLRTQEKDLSDAVASLRATIQKINRTTDELFSNAFASINEKFQEIFTFLFGGGEASLELVGSENAQEAGVDITARPPGKKKQAIALLSGGEKALTAIALIFAIFLTRPSPFCLLDEVDAPLDDANVTRFNDMLKSLADDTQFIVITHNKRTMEIADSLYGITMEEPGVSSVVSVDFPA